ncbi:MAG: hypothetical protein ACRDGU_02535 [Actinomycetota bacterium]
MGELEERGRVVKRLGVVLGLSLGWLSLLATQALAQYPPSPTPPASPPGGPDVAFTGASISLGVIILISLVIMGALLLVAGRRRKAGAVQ